MARTLKGNLTGRAARLNRLDQMQENISGRLRFQEHWFLVLSRLKELDPNWESWYDQQPEQTCGEMLPRIEEHITLLEEREEERDRQSEISFCRGEE